MEQENLRLLVSLLIKYSERYSTKVAAYCLMPNHYHLILKQGRKGSVGSFLKTTFNSYTQAVNRRFGISGTLFEGQAKVRPITTEAYCLRIIPYVHLNPVTANLVRSADQWDFSNFLEWIGERDSMLFDKELRDNYFPNPKDYEQFVRDYQIEKEAKELGEFLFNE